MRERIVVALVLTGLFAGARYEVLGIPEWVRTPQSMRAFPKLAADTSIQSAIVTMSKGADGGWTVDSPHSPQ